MAVVNNVVMYSTRFCPYCVRAKAVFAAKNIQYDEIDVGQSADLRQEMIEKSGQHTVPQIWIGSRHIGGCDELLALDRAGQLDAILSGAATSP